MKSLLVHALLTLCAGVFACVLALRDETPEEYKDDRVSVWDGNPAEVRSIRYESRAATASIEAHEDQEGRYFVVRLEKNEVSEDGGAPEHKTFAFVSTGSTERFLEKVAPLRAFRALGKLAPERLAEFSLAEPEGTFTIDIGGRVQRLKVGGKTHSGVERYVEDLDTGLAYAIPSELPSYLPYADTRLMDRMYHSFSAARADRVTIVWDGKTRNLVRLPRKVEGWADEKTPDALDETAGNWLSKLDRLQVMTFIEESPTLAPESEMLSVEYFVEGRRIGFLRVYRPAGGSGYYATSELVRWTTTPNAAVVDQLTDDLPSLFAQ